MSKQVEIPIYRITVSKKNPAQNYSYLSFYRSIAQNEGDVVTNEELIGVIHKDCYAGKNAQGKISIYRKGATYYYGYYGYGMTQAMSNNYLTLKTDKGGKAIVVSVKVSRGSSNVGTGSIPHWKKQITDTTIPPSEDEKGIGKENDEYPYGF